MPKIAEVKFTLKNPYGISLGQLFMLASIWKFRVTKSSTKSAIAFGEIPVTSYKKMFGNMPVKSLFFPPSPLSDFLNNIEITNITDVEE